jgi:hypothetical protein
MAGTPTRDLLGAWLLKANPTVWDVGRFLKSPDPCVRSWAVRPGSRAAMMQAGDRVLLWMSGDGRTGFDRGIWGLGWVTAPAEPWVDEKRGFWVDQQAREAVRARVQTDIPLLAEPVTATELRSHGIDRLEVQRMPQGANPSWVSRDELARLDHLLPDWPAKRP